MTRGLSWACVWFRLPGWGGWRKPPQLQSDGDALRFNCVQTSASSSWTGVGRHLYLRGRFCMTLWKQEITLSNTENAKPSQNLSVLSKSWFQRPCPLQKMAQSSHRCMFWTRLWRRRVVTMECGLLALQSQISVFHWFNIHLSPVYSRAFPNPNIVMSVLNCIVAIQIKWCAIVPGCSFFKGSKKQKQNPENMTRHPGTGLQHIEIQCMHA